PAEAVEHVERVQPSRWLRGFGSELRQQRNRRLVLPLVKQPGGRVAVPAIGMRERGDKPLRRRPAELRQRSLAKAVVRHDAVNPSAIAAARQIEVLLDERRQAGRVLDYLAIHIEDVERAVRG